MHLTRRLAVLFAAFIMLGLPEGVLGTAWPSIRASFDRPEAALAQLIIAYTLGYLVTTALLGRIVDRLGTDPAIRLGIGLTATALLGYTVSPVWALTLASGWLLGAGGGIVDAGVNADVALRHGQRTMNLLHAAFGVGATLGPLLVTVLLGLDASWRIAYGALLVVEVVLLVSLSPGGAARAQAPDEGEASASYAERVGRPRLLLAVSLVWFAVYVGAEVSVGQWSFSVLTEARGVGETTAGIAVAAYWGGLTAGRLALGILGDRLHPMTLLRGSMVLALGAMVWFLADTGGSIVALPIIGLAFSGMFPALVLMTSSWLPEALVTRAVGFQLAAASAGAIVSSATLGYVADLRGLDATVVGMSVLVVLLVAVHVATESVARS